MALFNTLKADTRLTHQRRLGLAADYAEALAAAATTGMRPQIRGRFLSARKDVMNKKQL